MSKTSQGPAKARTPEPAAPEPLPKTLKIAIWLMYGGAALSTLTGVLQTLAIATANLATLKKANPTFTIAQLHTQQHQAILGTAIFGLLEVALWIMVAWFTRRGVSWVRIIATALFAFNTWGTVGYFASGYAATQLAYATVLWLVGLGATVLLWLPASSAYLQPRSS